MNSAGVPLVRFTPIAAFSNGEYMPCLVRASFMASMLGSTLPPLAWRCTGVWLNMIAMGFDAFGLAMPW